MEHDTNTPATESYILLTIRNNVHAADDNLCFSTTQACARTVAAAEPCLSAQPNCSQHLRPKNAERRLSS
eukprot:1160061-Pelagomonas_calceolata.AAC.6